MQKFRLLTENFDSGILQGDMQYELALQYNNPFPAETGADSAQ